jgi:hypothetical protein
MNVKVSVGIDVGISGAIAAIDAATLEVLEVLDTPTVASEGRKLFDISAMAELYRKMLAAEQEQGPEKTPPAPALGQADGESGSSAQGEMPRQNTIPQNDDALPVIRSETEPESSKEIISPPEAKPEIKAETKMSDAIADALCLAYYGTL